MIKRAGADVFMKEFFTLFLPIALGNLFTFGSTFTAHLMVSGLGGDASAGIFLSNQVMQLLVFAITGIEAVVTVLGAQRMGDSDRKGFSGVASKAALLALLLSILLTIICIIMPNKVLSLFSRRKSVGNAAKDYLRLLSLGFPLYALTRILIASGKCVNRERVALAAPLVSLAVTVAIGLLTVNGPLGLGAMGAGISILSARAAELAVTVIMLSAGDNSGALSARALIRGVGYPSPAFLKTLLPIILGQAAWGAETLLATSLMSRYADGFAAVSFGVLTALSNLAYALMSGASSAVGIIVSHKVGGGADRGDYMSAARLGQLVFLGIGAVGAILILALKVPFVHIYGLTAADAELLGMLTPILALTFIATSYSASTLFGIIKSGGDVNFVLITDASMLLFLTLPVSLAVFSSGLGVAELYIATRLVHLFKCPIAYSRVRWGRWARRLTKSARSGTISI